MKALIFDFDELLADSTSLHKEAFKRTFDEYQISAEMIPYELSQNFIGKRLEDINKMIAEHFKMSVKPEVLTEKRNLAVLTLINSMQKLMPGARKVLEMGKNLGFKIALSSSGETRYLEKSLKFLKIEKYFDSIVTGDDVIKGKPDPECFVKAASLLDAEPEDSIVFEDAENGVKAAKKAGMKVIAVINTRTPKQDLSKADIILNSLEEVTEEMLR